jgi:hypothetical protein
MQTGRITRCLMKFRYETCILGAPFPVCLCPQARLQPRRTRRQLTVCPTDSRTCSQSHADTHVFLVLYYRHKQVLAAPLRQAKARITAVSKARWIWYALYLFH